MCLLRVREHVDQSQTRLEWQQQSWKSTDVLTVPINQGENLSVIRTLGGISPGTVRALNEPWRPVDPTPTPTVRPQFKQLPKLTHQLSQFFNLSISENYVPSPAPWCMSFSPKDKRLGMAVPLLPGRGRLNSADCLNVIKCSDGYSITRLLQRSAFRI